MFREEHYHMTLTIKTPPRIFSEISSNFFGTANSVNSSEWLHLRKLYLFSQPNNYSCGRAAQGQMSKFTWSNTVTSSRTLVRSYAGLKGTEGFARSCFRKIHLIETIMKSFLQLHHNLRLQ